jgi:hypothetical protein
VTPADGIHLPEVGDEGERGLAAGLTAADGQAGGGVQSGAAGRYSQRPECLWAVKSLGP